MYYVKDMWRKIILYFPFLLKAFFFGTWRRIPFALDSFFKNISGKGNKSCCLWTVIDFLDMKQEDLMRRPIIEFSFKEYHIFPAFPCKQ